ncbi:MAG TPA: SusD/RagB family nutrient-binding outer membrane lipoprotein [Chitinophagaceae bacterium]|nr:SusD/RagB family nutrient-binding outer membrane lipoprotein [Chitinophagaceae bacterium]
MKWKKLVWIFSVGVCFSVTACKKQLDINQNPNNPSTDQASPQLLFPAAEISAASAIGGELAIIGMLWSEFTTEDVSSSQYRNYDSYNVTSTDLNTSYNQLYTGALNDLQLILNKTKVSEDWNYNLMATVLKVYTYQVLVDLYDQVPYSQALQGTGDLQPVFDHGDSIYESLLATLDTALNKDFSASSNTIPGNEDFLFGGDMLQWKAFANTLKLKMYLRMVNAKPAEAEAGIKALYSAGAVFLTEDAGITQWTSVPNKQNPFYAQNIYALNTPSNLKASVTFISWLKANNDPRVVSYFGTADPVGIDQGNYLSTNPVYRTSTTFVQAPTDPVQFISAPESYFMQAEARERYFAGDQAQALYNAGVNAAFSYYGFDATSFISTGGVYEYPVSGTLDEKINAIITQKWASLPGSHALEAWFERNRTAFPKTSPVYSTDLLYVPGTFVVSATSAIGQAFPKRIVFPDNERSRNKNTPAQVPITTPVWWGK